jgi:hypothetical protein
MATGSLYFHSPCFDGVASAVLAWDFLQERNGWTTPVFRPVGYDVRQTWLGQLLAQPIAVVDFLFHPDAAFWADHHVTTFLTTAAREHFEQASQRDRLFIYEPQADSCAGLLWRRLANDFGHQNPRYAELVQWAEKIDAARYVSVEEAIASRAPAQRLSLGFALGQTENYAETLVRELRDKPLEAVAELPEPLSRFKRARDLMELGFDHFKRNAHVENDGIVVFDVDQQGAIVNRYAPFRFFPNARYSAGVIRWPGGARITAMRNPWREFRSVPLGHLAETLGGGGHERVGSVLVSGDRVAEAQSILARFLSGIRKAEKNATNLPAT